MNGNLCLDAIEGKDIQGSNTQKPGLEDNETSANSKKPAKEKSESRMLRNHLKL